MCTQTCLRLSQKRISPWNQHPKYIPADLEGALSNNLLIYPLYSNLFPSYCDNCTTARLKELTTQLLKDLERFQSRAYGNNEIKARAHPRFVVGFREALSRLHINKVRLLLLAPDCEECTAQGRNQKHFKTISN